MSQRKNDIPNSHVLFVETASSMMQLIPWLKSVHSEVCIKHKFYCLFNGVMVIVHFKCIAHKNHKWRNFGMAGS